MSCPICSHPHRHYIERSLLSGVSLDDIIRDYSDSSSGSGGIKFTKDQLRIHSVCHIAMPDKDTTDSLASKLSLKETDMLVLSCNEYMATLQRMGGVINSKLDKIEAGELETRHELTKPLVDLYLGTGEQIRETVKLMSDAYANMNSEEASISRSGLSVLSSALDRSRKEFGSNANAKAV